MLFPGKLKPSGWTSRIPSLIWGFTESDSSTFVVPDTAFGILGALAATSLSQGVEPSWTKVLRCLPLVLAYNWINVLLDWGLPLLLGAPGAVVPRTRLSGCAGGVEHV